MPELVETALALPDRGTRIDRKNVTLLTLLKVAKSAPAPKVMH